LRYEPDTVAITGLLVRKTFPGPPNYESIAKGDTPETGFYLELALSICTTASSDSDVHPATEGVHLVQLVLDQPGYDRLRPRLGQKVTVRGTLFAPNTGHHHAPLLLKVVHPRHHQSTRSERSSRRLTRASS